jgi:hypothetical protein
MLQQLEMMFQRRIADHDVYLAKYIVLSNGEELFLAANIAVLGMGEMEWTLPLGYTTFPGVR